MLGELAIDTDVLLKTAAFRSASEFLHVIQPAPSALGLTHLIAPKQLARLRGLKDKVSAQAQLAKLLGELGKLEPSASEIELASELATKAQELDLPLDPGEAQLIAILLSRPGVVMVTGDKRALCALSSLITSIGYGSDNVAGRFASFEQVIILLLDVISAKEFRLRVCLEPDIDGGMRLACSCGRDPWESSQLIEACTSYIRDLREKTAPLLALSLPFT